MSNPKCSDEIDSHLLCAPKSKFKKQNKCQRAHLLLLGKQDTSESRASKWSRRVPIIILTSISSSYLSLLIISSSGYFVNRCMTIWALSSKLKCDFWEKLSYFCLVNMKRVVLRKQTLKSVAHSTKLFPGHSKWRHSCREDYL